ncbi:MAG: metallophosphoesterase family protein, partial [Phycisphaerae bacterium]
GEAGYYQSYQAGLGEPLALQRIATTARKQYFLNPLSDTYPEGGENEGWSEAAADTAAGGVASENRSPLQNYFAWTWGDALFVVLDCHRYTNPGGSTPASVDEWTLGTVQFEWFRKVLTASEAKWKVVLCHHLVGGWPWDGAGRRSETNYYYGRGGGRYARVGEQARITDLMNQTGARFFLYGHDHVFCHQPAEGIEFVCCGRPSYLNAEWYSRPGWREAYGRTAARDPHDFYAAIGYTRLSVSPAAFEIEYVRTGKDADGGDNVDTPIGQVAYRAAFS